ASRRAAATPTDAHEDPRRGTRSATSGAWPSGSPRAAAAQEPRGPRADCRRAQARPDRLLTMLQPVDPAALAQLTAELVATTYHQLLAERLAGRLPRHTR